MAKDGLNTLVITHKPLNELILKRLILLFDKVSILHPQENNFLIPSDVASLDFGNMEISMANYAPLYNGSKYLQSEELLINQFDYAYKKGILNIINLKARRFYENHWLSLRLAYEFDTGNPNLMQMTKKLMENSDDYSIHSAAVRGMFIQPNGIKIYPDIPEVPNIYTNEESIRYAHEIQAFSILGKLNRSLMVAGVLDLTPSFIDYDISNIFIEKYQVAKNNHEQQVIETFQQLTNNHIQNVQYLLYKISETIIPDTILNEIPVRELVYARNNNFEKLYKLRRKLIESANFLAENEFNHDFINEVEIYIAKEVEPYIIEYTNSFRDNLIHFLKVSGTAVGAMSTTAIGFHQSLSPILIAVLSGISATVGSHISDLPNYINNKNRQKFQNTFSYFLNFR
ncbi:hypothetical protein [Bacillus sp. 1P02SD]|uniref:hypothetical protein n=1 Tax=Bacillus sp. 1P02SD TaxID=3132264 RepID=UPI00399F2C17